MSLTIIELHKANGVALETVNLSLKRLRQKRVGAPPTILNHINAQINECRIEITRLSIINTHLEAASTIVKPMSAEDQKELKRLADILDKAIRSDMILNATLEATIALVDTAQEVGDRVREAT
ncbi:MAG: hypothetical protein H0U72_08040 [Nitrosospira sp.]|nr:hypothetical protein [Nitrosospira sp.]